MHVTVGYGWQRGRSTPFRGRRSFSAAPTHERREKLSLLEIRPPPLEFLNGLGDFRVKYFWVKNPIFNVSAL